VSNEPQPTQTPSPAEPRPALDDPRPAPQTAEPQTAAPQTTTTPQQPSPEPPPLPHHKIRPTRISGLWLAVTFFAVVLLFLLIFILQNSRGVDISYLGMHGHLSLGVAMLLAAVCGVLLTVLAGAARISQLHAVARRHRRADARHTTAGTAGPPADPGQ
jgi:uncharacterized integral membrane protein